MLRKFMIERDIPAIGSFEREQLKGAAAQSNKVLKELGPDIQWQESYVAGGGTRRSASISPRTRT
ncbi:MAG: nickel-binding protein [Rhizomicrobium sp.]